MALIPITDERMAQLEKFARSRAQDTTTALDSVLAEYLAWDRRDFQQALEGISEGCEDLKAGRTQLAEDMFEDLQIKHALSR